MKQKIGPDQINELSDKGKGKLRELWKPRMGDWIVYYIPESAGAAVVIDSDSSYKDSLIPQVTCLADTSRMQGDANLWKPFLSDSETLPLLSIGQMIEFLDKYQHNNEEGVGPNWAIRLVGSQDDERYCMDLGRWDDKVYSELELCDALWQAVKEVLEENH